MSDLKGIMGGLVVAAGLSAFLNPAAVAQETRGPVSGAPQQWDGLVLKQSSKVDAAYVDPEADLSGYTTVILGDADVSFSKDWDPNRGERGVDRVSAKDIQDIRQGVADLFREVFTEELTEGGYELVEEPSHTTLLIRPAIVDLYINSVEGSRPGRTYTYTAEAGRMTLVVELRDSATGDVLARAVDRSRARKTGMYTMSSRNTNVAEARRMFKAWADLLRQALDEAHAKGD